MALNINLPQWFLDKSEVKRLNGGQFMLLVYLYGLAVFEQTDGYLPADVLEAMPRGVGTEDYLNDLLGKGLLRTSTKTGHAYYLTHYKVTQSSAEELKARLDRSLENNRRRQAEWRERQRQKVAVQEQRDNFLLQEAAGASYQPQGYNPNAVWETATPGSGGNWH